jgi:hypothetical protein
MRRSAIVLAIALAVTVPLSGCGGSSDADAFLAAYYETGEDYVPTLTVDEAEAILKRVCAGDETDPEVRFSVAEDLAGERWGPSNISSAIRYGVEAAGCP